jgi:hypothetical protein
MADPKPTPAAKPAPAKPAPAKPAAAAAGAKQSTAVAVPEGEAPAKESKLGWILGWIVLPGTVVGGIFGGGVLLGAHNHDGWFASAVMWVVNLF